jgi:chromosome segregation ATPase
VAVGDATRDPSATGAAPVTDAAGSREALAAALGRSSAQLDALRADLALSESVRERLAAEVQRLRRRLDDAEIERTELADKLRHRDGLIGQVFGSRSWRWTQALRRALRRD